MHQYLYFLVHNEYKIFLFECGIQFKTEAQSLKQYENGLYTGHDSCSITRISQVWSELSLCGLTGQVSPVELIRVLCAYGANIQCVGKPHAVALKKSYKPVVYYVEISQRETYELNELIIGHYYTTARLSADQKFPKFCRMLELDLDLKRDHFQTELSKLFYSGYKIVSLVSGCRLVLAQKDLLMNTLQGTGNEETLFYVGLADAA
jgi:hypothetical protein